MNNIYSPNILGVFILRNLFKNNSILYSIYRINKSQISYYNERRYGKTIHKKFAFLDLYRFLYEYDCKKNIYSYTWEKEYDDINAILGCLSTREDTEIGQLIIDEYLSLNYLLLLFLLIDNADIMKSNSNNEHSYFQVIEESIFQSVVKLGLKFKESGEYSFSSFSKHLLYNKIDLNKQSNYTLALLPFRLRGIAYNYYDIISNKEFGKSDYGTNVRSDVILNFINDDYNYSMRYKLLDLLVKTGQNSDYSSLFEEYMENNGGISNQHYTSFQNYFYFLIRENNLSKVQTVINNFRNALIETNALNKEIDV